MDGFLLSGKGPKLVKLRPCVGRVLSWILHNEARFFGIAQSGGRLALYAHRHLVGNVGI